MGFIIDGDEPKSEWTVLLFYQIELMHRPVSKENMDRTVTLHQNISSTGHASPLHTITCSMLTTETLRRTYEIITKLIIKAAEIVCECRISRSDKNLAFPRGVTTFRNFQWQSLLLSRIFKGKVTNPETPGVFFKNMVLTIPRFFEKRYP